MAPQEHSLAPVVERIDDDLRAVGLLAEGAVGVDNRGGAFQPVPSRIDDLHVGRDQPFDRFVIEPVQCIDQLADHLRAGLARQALVQEAEDHSGGDPRTDRPLSL
mgnify:CR=1 FL=1